MKEKMKMKIRQVREKVKRKENIEVEIKKQNVRKIIGKKRQGK